MICNPLDFLPISSPINRVRTAALPRLETPTLSVPRCSQKETCRDGRFHRGCVLWMARTQHTPHFPTLLSAKGLDKLTTTFRDVLHASPQEGFIWRGYVSLEWHRSIGPSVCHLYTLRSFSWGLITWIGRAAREDVPHSPLSVYRISQTTQRKALGRTRSASLLTSSSGHREEQRQHQHQDSYLQDCVLGSDTASLTCWTQSTKTEHSIATWANGMRTVMHLERMCTLMSAPWNQNSGMSFKSDETHYEQSRQLDSIEQPGMFFTWDHSQQWTLCIVTGFKDQDAQKNTRGHLWLTSWVQSVPGIRYYLLMTMANQRQSGGGGSQA